MAKASNSLISEASLVEPFIYIRPGIDYRVIIVDTPGFDDEGDPSEEEILRRIVAWLVDS